MQLLHSGKCCCCIDLRTGGLILGFLSLIGAVMQVFDPQTTNIIGAVIAILAYGAWLYGIYTKKTDFMLPAVVLSIITLVLMALFFVGFLIASIVARQYVIDFVNNKGHGEKVNINDAYWVAVIIILVFILAVTALIWHFTSVMYSLWKSMKEGARPNATYGA